MDSNRIKLEIIMVKVPCKRFREYVIMYMDY